MLKRQTVQRDNAEKCIRDPICSPLAKPMPSPSLAFSFYKPRETGDRQCVRPYTLAPLKAKRFAVPLGRPVIAFSIARSAMRPHSSLGEMLS